MKIGITYDLKSEYLKLGYTYEQVGEFEKDETIDGIDNALKTLGYKTDRIGNAKQLMHRLQQGETWDLVFNFCEGVYGVGREAQVPAILDVYNIPYIFSDVLTNALTLDKGMTKRVIRDAKIPTADFVVVKEISDLDHFTMNFPVFAKPNFEGSGKGISSKSKANNITELIEVCNDLLINFKQPVLVEKYLTGREFTVGLTGTGKNSKVLGIMEINFKSLEHDEIYGFEVKNNYETIVEYTVPEKEIAEACYQVALDSWNVLNCRDGGRVDVRLDDNGIPNFIEVNPLPGLSYIDSDLPFIAYRQGYTFTDLIKMIVDSARERVSVKKESREEVCC